MSISTMAVNVGGTCSVTGGTSTSYLAKGTTLDRRTLILSDNAEYVDQVRVELRVRDPKVNLTAPNGFTQARSEVYMEFPLLLDNGKRTANSFRLLLSVDPETTDAEIAEMRAEAAQLIFQSSLDDFWNKQATS